MNESVIISVENLKKLFPVRMGFLPSLFSRETAYVHAVDGVSFDIAKSEILCLAGESGCGKTTTGKLMVGLLEPTEGKVVFEGREVSSRRKDEVKEMRQKMQMIFQDPYASLNPRMTVYEIVSEPLEVNRLVENEAQKEEKTFRALEVVELKPPENFVGRYPHELSGGQRQRVAVARAIILGPSLMVADEPVSMLDVSIRAAILNLLTGLRETNEIAFLYITHELSVARHIADRVAIMYLGKLVEIGPTEKVIRHPLHPYTEALMSVIPSVRLNRKRHRTILSGEPPNPVSLPPGCRFCPRCPSAKDVCRKLEPLLAEVEREHQVACHMKK